MQSNLHQSALNAASSPASAASVSVMTVGTGVSTFLEIFPPLLGLIASMLGILLSILLARNYIKLWQVINVDLELKRKQIQAIDERKKSRGKE